MKRTAMPGPDAEKLAAWRRRSKPLDRTVSDRRKASMPAGGDKPRRKTSKSRIPDRIRAGVRRRSDGSCEARIPGVCDITAHHMHHVVLRSRGGQHTVENLVHLCHPCHRWAHDNPAAATARGLMASLNPPEET